MYFTLGRNISALEMYCLCFCYACILISLVAHMVICLSQQHATIMDFSRLYEVSNSVDEHRDMRLDIDSMTYEVLSSTSSVDSHHTQLLSDMSLLFSLQELLALEEQIGDVNTGLTKCLIVDKLRTSLYVPGTSSMSDQPSNSSLENDACIICQVLLFHYN